MVFRELCDTYRRSNKPLCFFAADTKTIGIFVQELFALSAVNYFIFHNIRCFCFFRARTSRNTRQTSRKGRNLGQNVRTHRSILFSFYLSSK